MCVPAETILAYLRGGQSAEDVFEDYPSLPVTASTLSFAGRGDV
ncbi:MULTISPECIES: DUF433 domain-containing protein [Bradyrhizobium]